MPGSSIPQPFHYKSTKSGLHERLFNQYYFIRRLKDAENKVTVFQAYWLSSRNACDTHLTSLYYIFPFTSPLTFDTTEGWS